MSRTPGLGMSRLVVENAVLGYRDTTICADVSVAVPDGSITVIVGPNACGKSTLLKGLSRLIRPSSGAVLLDGKDIHTLPSKQVARSVGLLPQSPQAPDGIRVVDLVARGRYPHQKLLQAWSSADEQAVSAAMAATGVEDLSGSLVDELSGGQRQRVWMAVALAQQTPILLLDEPTTFLDIAHQVELLELCRSLNRERGHTVVAVLHDLNQACRYADQIIAMVEGEIVAMGRPGEVVTERLVRAVFGLDCRVLLDPESGTPLVVPLWRHRPA